MHLQNLLFYITLTVPLTQSVLQEYYDYSDSQSDYYYYDDSQEEYTNVEESVLHEIRNISVDKGSDVVLTCSQQNGNGCLNVQINNKQHATWLNIQPNDAVSINNTLCGVSELSIRNVTLNQTYDCQRSNNIVQRVVITVYDPQVRFLRPLPGIVKNGTNIRLSCVVRSIQPVDTAYLRVDDAHTSQKYIAYWESRKRMCTRDDYNRTDCAIESTFHYDRKVLKSGNYSCGYKYAESKSFFVEVISSEPTIYEATVECASQDVQEKIIQFAIEALEKYGLTHDTATYIRLKCNTEFEKKLWNCIIGRQASEFSLSPNIIDEPHSSFRFSLGSIYFSIFRTNK